MYQNVQKKRGAVAHYPTPGIAKRPLCRYMKQQPTLYTDIIPAYDKEVYSRAQAFVAYYPRTVKIWRFLE